MVVYDITITLLDLEDTRCRHQCSGGIRGKFGFNDIKDQLGRTQVTRDDDRRVETRVVACDDWNAVPAWLDVEYGCALVLLSPTAEPRPRFEVELRWLVEHHAPLPDLALHHGEEALLLSAGAHLRERAAGHGRNLQAERHLLSVDHNPQW